MTLDDFQTLLSAMDYPMFVVTCCDGDDRAGCLVGFATQCSIDPPLFLVCISQTNRTERIARQAGFLAVHLLSPGEGPVARLFGSETGDEVDKFEQCRWEAGPGGAPLLAECPNRFVGRVVDRRETGDHVGYVLEVVDGAVGSGAVESIPLLTYQQVKDLSPGHEA